MTLNNPLHPGRILRMSIDGLHRPVADVAAGLGVTRQQLYNVINGKSAVTPEMAIRLEQGIGSTAETWLRMQAAYDLAKARDLAPGIKIARLRSRTIAAD